MFHPSHIRTSFRSLAPLIKINISRLAAYNQLKSKHKAVSHCVPSTKRPMLHPHERKGTEWISHCPISWLHGCETRHETAIASTNKKTTALTMIISGACLLGTTMDVVQQPLHDNHIRYNQFCQAINILRVDCISTSCTGRTHVLFVCHCRLGHWTQLLGLMALGSSWQRHQGQAKKGREMNTWLRPVRPNPGLEPSQVYGRNWRKELYNRRSRIQALIKWVELHKLLL